MVEQTDKSQLSASRQSSDEVENDKPDQYLRTNVIDVFGRETEPICDYLRCRHKFSEHGLGCVLLETCQETIEIKWSLIFRGGCSSNIPPCQPKDFEPYLS